MDIIATTLYEAAVLALAEFRRCGFAEAIWTLPIALCGGIGAAFPSYPVIYRK